MTKARWVGGVLWLVLVSSGLLLVWMAEDDIAHTYNGINGPAIDQIIDCQLPSCLRVLVPERYLGGSDSACVAAGMWMLRHFELDPQLESILLTNKGWVPSAYRLVDERWARCLADEESDQTCEELENPGWYDKDP